MLKFQASWLFAVAIQHAVCVGKLEDKVSHEAAYFSLEYDSVFALNESKEEGLNNNNQGGGTKNMNNNLPILEITVRIVRDLAC